MRKSEILKEINLAEFYKEYGLDITKKGNHNCCLPGHEDKTPSLSINPDDGWFKCFGCGAKGDVFNWFMLYHNVDFKLTLKQLGEKYNIQPTTKPYLYTGKSKKFDLNKLIEQFHRELPENIRRYLNNRGISDNLIEKYKLGWGEIYKKYWIVIPVKDINGSHVLLKLRRPPEEDNLETNTPKYIFYPKNSKAELFEYESLKESDEILVCEGELDKLVLEARGVNAVTSTAGANTFKPEWIELLKTKKKIYVCFDNDESGKEGSKKLISELRRHTKAEIFNIELPEPKGKN